MEGKYGVGIDIGSTCAKTVVIGPDKNILWRDLRPTGWSSVETAEAIRRDLQAVAEQYDLPVMAGEEAGTDCEGRKVCFVATGYGRISVPFADKCVTEISCHAKGSVFLFGAKDLNVIDIGGQDTKIII